MRKFRFFLISVVVFFTGVSTICFGQDVKTVNDSLRSITVLADSVKIRPAGLTKIDAHQTRFMVTALGEGDVIKYIQTLPGISTGTESSSSFYVRGGNLGNNVITLDGVRIYGYGHLLGITSVFPNSIVEDVSFNVGGCYATNFESDIFIDDNVKFKDKYTIPMFEYLTADYYSVNGRISTRIPIVGKKFTSFIGAYIEASTQRYIGDFELFNKTAFNQFGGGINYTF